MANSNQPDDSKEDALAALHGMGESQEHEDQEENAGGAVEGEHEVMEEGTPGASASGFVGMLAQEGAGGSGAGSGAGGGRGRVNRDEIKMAREITMPVSAPAPNRGAGLGGPGGIRKPLRKAPGWYHGAVPVMYSLGSVLVLIGLWAVGALIYMLVKSAGEDDVGYWFLSKHLNDDTGLWSYTSGSWVMAIAMLLCIPVAAALAYMAVVMQKQIRMDQQCAAGK